MRMKPKSQWKINQKPRVYVDKSPDIKPDKGHENGSCNRTACQQSPATWFSNIMKKWYCARCADLIGNDPHNRRDWETDLKKYCPNGLFETRAMMDLREESEMLKALTDKMETQNGQ